MKLSIAIPAHNEEENIAQVIEQVEDKIKFLFDLIVVNDHSTDRTAEIVAGLAIPGKEGKGGVVSVDEKTGWFSFWSEHYDSELGIGIVADPKYVSGYTEYRVPKVEKSHVFVHLRPINGKVIYYTGFGWKKNSRFSTRKAWEEYLREFASLLSFPAEIKISHP